MADEEIVGFEHNCITGAVVPVYMTDELKATLDQIAKDEKARIKEEKAKVKAKAALLDKLGITEEEAKLLLS